MGICRLKGEDSTAKIVCHGDKFKRTQVNALERHNERKNENYSNNEIDLNRTSENYSLIPSPENYYKEVMNHAAKRKNPTGKALRKDAVVLSEFIISSSKDFFDNLNKESQRKFFQSAFDFLFDFFGKNNAVYAVIHNDEHTPHLHFGFVPMTTDNRLCAKDIINKYSLKMLQDKLPKHLKNCGFDIERGVENSSAVHLEPNEYKAEMERQKIEIKSEIEIIAKKKTRIKEIEDVPVKKSLIGDNVTVSREDYEKVSAIAKKQIAAEKKEKKFLKENEKLKQENSSLHDEISELKKKLDSIKSISLALENGKLKEKINSLENSIWRFDSFIDSLGLNEKFKNYKQSQKNRENYR